MDSSAPIFVECQCACGSFWRFEPGQEPDELLACPHCDDSIPLGDRFVSGERGKVTDRGLAYVTVGCTSCGFPWNVKRETYEAVQGSETARCIRCDITLGIGNNVEWREKGQGNDMATKKESNGDGRVEIDRFEEKVLCKIPPEDIERKADDLANSIEERDQLKQRRRAAMATFKDKLTGLDEKILELGESVRTKSERRNVVCIAYLIERQNKVLVVRSDTGEIESERAATPEDRQEHLFGGDKDKGPKGKGRTSKKDAQPEATAE